MKLVTLARLKLPPRFSVPAVTEKVPALDHDPAMVKVPPSAPHVPPFRLLKVPVVKFHVPLAAVHVPWLVQVPERPFTPNVLPPADRSVSRVPNASAVVPTATVCAAPPWFTSLPAF